MAKIQKSFRLESNVVQSLEDLLKFYNSHMPEFSLKKANSTDVVSLLIEKEVANLKKQGYDV